MWQGCSISPLVRVAESRDSIQYFHNWRVLLKADTVFIISPLVPVAKDRDRMQYFPIGLCR